MQACIDRNIPFLSSMGMARRKDPTKLIVTEIEKQVTIQWQNKFVNGKEKIVSEIKYGLLHRQKFQHR